MYTILGIIIIFAFFAVLFIFIAKSAGFWKTIVGAIGVIIVVTFLYTGAALIVYNSPCFIFQDLNINPNACWNR